MFVPPAAKKAGLPFWRVSGHDAIAHRDQRGFRATFAGFGDGDFAKDGMGVYELWNGQQVFKEFKETDNTILSCTELTAIEHGGDVILGIDSLFFWIWITVFQIATKVAFTITTGHNNN